jgi:thiamine pyrophosphate-dependent acetolactate synthase large subunit-like protein
MKMMNPLKDIDKLVEILAKAEKELIYLGPEPQIDSLEELAESIEIAEGFGLGSGLLEYLTSSPP